MKHFLDLGSHKLEGLQEFTEKLNIDKTWKVYAYEPNILLKKEIVKIVNKIKNNYKSLEFYNKAVMDQSGTITFNCHRGAWKDLKKDEYWNQYTTGSNALELNPNIDMGNGVCFDIVQYDVECISIDEILEGICLDDPSAKIYIS